MEIKYKNIQNKNQKACWIMIMLKKELWLQCATSINKEETVQLLYYLSTSQSPSCIIEFKTGGKRGDTKQTYLLPHAYRIGGVNYHN